MTYALHSVVREPAFRSHRAQAAVHVRKKHYIGTDQLRLLPERPLIVSDDVVAKNLAEIKQKVADHILEVRTLDGRLVDLETLTVGPSDPTPLKPHPKLDSVADDKPTGIYIPPYVGDDTSMPAVLPPGEKPSLIKSVAREIALEEAAAEREAPDPTAADDELDAAVEAAQTAASVEVRPSAPSAREQVSSEGNQRKVGKPRR